MRLIWIIALALVSTACRDAPPAVSALPRKQTVTVAGENYCLGCSLKKTQGAAAQCSVYGHRHALRVDSATDEGGAAISTLAGQTLHYLDNDRSAPLVSGDEYHGKKVRIRGVLYGDARTIEVTEVSTP